MIQKYALLAIELKGEDVFVHHMCLYPLPPTQVDIDSLQKELNEDKQFGLVGKKNYKIIVCPEHLVDSIKHQLFNEGWEKETHY